MKNVFWQDILIYLLAFSFTLTLNVLVLHSIFCFYLLSFSSSPSLNQGLLLEQERLMSDYDKVKAEEQEKDAKLQKLM